MRDKKSLLGYADKEYRPIIREETAKILVDLIAEKQPKYILEIGTLLGYSAGLMLENSNESFVTTIEKDSDNANYAIKNLNSMGFEGRFEVVNCDAIDFLKEETNNHDKYDFIFLDGPKGQYIKYLPYLKQLLKPKGILAVDDILFYGLVYSKDKIEHKHRTIVNNLRKFLYEIQNSEDFDTKIYEIEDGLSVSIKK